MERDRPTWLHGSYSQDKGYHGAVLRVDIGFNMGTIWALLESVYVGSMSTVYFDAQILGTETGACEEEDLVWQSIRRSALEL